MSEIGTRAHEALWKKIVEIQAGVYGPTYTFPPDLSKAERKFLHNSAEKLHLKTKSQGSPPNRSLTVYAKAVAQAPADALTLSTAGSDVLQQMLEASSLPPPPNRRTSAFVEWQLNKGEVGASARLSQRDQEKFYVNWEQTKQSPSYQKMYEERKHLPVCHAKDTILDTIEKNQVVVLSGPTGTGKSTQIPHLILDRLAQAKQNCNIIITQPRRVACIALATRVAAETATPLGRLVGYQIRLEARKSAETKMLFCTVGILLRRLVSDRTLDGVTHVIVDEVHERGSLSDFCLILLRDILPRRPELKVLVMSATLNAESFSRYFNNAPLIELQGRAFPVEEVYLEEILKQIQYVPKVRRNPLDGTLQRVDGSLITDTALATFQSHFQGIDQLMLTRLAALDGELDHGLVVEVAAWICKSKPAGAILIFCPGWHDIQKVMDGLERHPNLRERSKFRIIPLHGAVTTFDDSVFRTPPQGVRKIVVATNVAETSLTIEDVIYVLDTGLLKEKAYDPHTKMSSLVPMSVSRANADQRRGRAGRCQPGICFRLYSSLYFQQMEAFQLPELLRTPLEEICLQVKLQKLGDPRLFLKNALEPPEPRSITSAMDSLVLLGAMHPETTDLTELGFHLASLPIDPRLGKMMIYGCLLHCLLPMLTLAALSDRDPFLFPAQGITTGQVRNARLELANGSYSDHMALLNAFYGYDRQKQSGQHHAYCEQYLLSPTTLAKVESSRNQYFRILKENGIIGKDVHDVYSPGINALSKSSVLVKSLVSGCLYPSVARTNGGRSFITRDSLKATISMSSVNCKVKLPTNMVVFEAGERTIGGIFLRTTSLATPYSLLLFGGKRMSCMPADNLAALRHEQQVQQQTEREEQQKREEAKAAVADNDEATAAEFDTFLAFDSDEEDNLVVKRPSATAATSSATSSSATSSSSTSSAASSSTASSSTTASSSEVKVHLPQNGADTQTETKTETKKSPEELAIAEVDNWIRFSMKKKSSELLSKLQDRLNDFLRDGLLCPNYTQQPECVQFAHTLAHFLELEAPPTPGAVAVGPPPPGAGIAVDNPSGGPAIPKRKKSLRRQKRSTKKNKKKEEQTQQ